MTTRCLTLAILILAGARTASAQTPIAPRVELGGTFSAILPVVAADGPVFLLGGAGPLVRGPVSCRACCGILRPSGRTS